jgi:hypothetical protein
MTEIRPADHIPPMHEIYNFMRSNPNTSWEMIVEVLKIGSDETDGPSAGRFRELWKQCGGAVDRKGNAWVEMQTLPGVLRRIIDASNRIAVTPPSEGADGG